MDSSQHCNELSSETLQQQQQQQQYQVDNNALTSLKKGPVIISCNFSKDCPQKHYGLNLD